MFSSKMRHFRHCFSGPPPSPRGRSAAEARRAEAISAGRLAVGLPLDGVVPLPFELRRNPRESAPDVRVSQVEGHALKSKTPHNGNNDDQRLVASTVLAGVEQLLAV